MIQLDRIEIAYHETCTINPSDESRLIPAKYVIR